MTDVPVRLHRETVPIRYTHDPGLAAVSEHTLHPVFRADLLELVVDVFDDELGRALDAKVGDKADRELACARVLSTVPVLAPCVTCKSLTLDGRRDDGFGARSGCCVVSEKPRSQSDQSVEVTRTESALDTVQRQARVSWSDQHRVIMSQEALAVSLTHPAHECRDCVLANGLVAAHCTVDVLHFKVNGLELLALVLGDGGDLFLDTRNEDLARGGNELGHWGGVSANISHGTKVEEHRPLQVQEDKGVKGAILTQEDQVGHRLVDRTAKDTRVEVRARTRDADLVVVDTPETVREARSLGVEPVVVCATYQHRREVLNEGHVSSHASRTRNAHAVYAGEELVLLALDELVEVLRAVFFHSLEAHLHVDLAKGSALLPHSSTIFTRSRTIRSSSRSPHPYRSTAQGSDSDSDSREEECRDSCAPPAR